MKRGFVLLLLLTALFLVACSSEQLPEGSNEGEMALTGQGFSTLTPEQRQFYLQCNRGECWGFLKNKDYKSYRTCYLGCLQRAESYSPQTHWCEDTDGGLDYRNKGTVTTDIIPNGRGDYCYTWSSSGRTALFEGNCNGDKYQVIQKRCAELGENYVCEEGVCLEKASCEDSCVFSYELGDTKEVFTLPLGKTAVVQNKGAFDHLYFETTEISENYCRINLHSCRSIGEDYVCEESSEKFDIGEQEGASSLGFFTLNNIECNNFNFELYENNQLIESSSANIYSEEVISCIDLDSDSQYLQETVIEYTQNQDGSVSKEEFEDHCINENQLEEFVCVDGVHNTQSFNCQCDQGKCDSGNLVVVGKKTPLPDFPAPPTPDFPKQYELEITPVELTSGNIRVFVPEGYELLGEKHIEDLQNCLIAVPSFIGTETYWDGVVLKEYVVVDGNNLPAGFQGGGGIFYPRSQEILDSHFQEAEDDFPGSHFYNLSLDYCANTHEFTHYVIDNTIIPSWANEGIAQYTQRNIQRDVYNTFSCNENGFSGIDFWTGGEENVSFPYFDLSKEYTNSDERKKHVRTRICFWELFDEQFSPEKRREAFQLLRDEYTGVIDKYPVYKLKDGTLISVPNKSTFFIENVLFEVVNYEELKTFLEKFGLEEGVDYILD